MVQIKSLFCLISVCMALCIQPSIANAELRPTAKPPHFVVDAGSGKVLASHREFVRWAPASLTKLMTAYTVFRALELQHIALNSPIRVTEEALAQPPSKMGFPIGTMMTVEAAVQIIMVKSANDISVALAQAVGGDEETFVGLMNAHAKRLGMHDTRFINPHGLHDPDQFTTARDMAILGMALTREFEKHDGFFDIPAIRITGRRLRNHNGLLRLFDGTNGLKTGYVCASGYNIVVRTERENQELIAVVLGGKSGLSRNVRAAELLAASFEKGNVHDAPLIHDLRAPDGTSLLPIDITRNTCPRKYAATAKPKARPQAPPLTEESAGIDGMTFPGLKERLENPLHQIPRPEFRPEYTPKKVAEAENAESGEGTTSGAAAVNTTPSTLKERSKAHLKPRKDLRPDVRVSLNGAVGPNPFGILHTNGGPYKAPPAVPKDKPDLDLAGSQE